MYNLWNRWKALWHPERYHGWGRKSSYFEGWYFKIVNADGSQALAIIPGISRDKEGVSHSFIQVIDGTRGETSYYNFEDSDFISFSHDFKVHIQNNSFEAGQMELNLPDLKGHLTFDGLTSWPKSLGAPGIMGWYSFVPFMQCYHGVVSLHHRINGQLRFRNRDIDFTDGIGYIEKDWGTSFPKCWIWMQSNHFGQGDRKISPMASVAHIPWMGRYFVGFLVGLWLDDKLLKFTTYTGAKMLSSMTEETVHLTFKKGKKKLSLIAHKGNTGELVSPIQGEMVGKVNESLTAHIEVQLKDGDSILFEGVGRNAGLEVAGDVDILLTDKS